MRGKAGGLPIDLSPRTLARGPLPHVRDPGRLYMEIMDHRFGACIMVKPSLTLLLMTAPWLVGIDPAYGLQTSETVRVHQLSLTGRGLSAAQSKKLEVMSAKSPDDMDARIQLVSYYWMKQYTDPTARDAHAKHVLWLIENRPESAFAGGPEMGIHSFTNAVAYRRGAELWRSHAEKDNASTTILSNASNYFQLSDRDIAETYLKRCCELEPDNGEWFAALGHMYELSGSEKALGVYETALKKSDDSQRYYLLTSVAKAAIAAGKFDKAKKYALMLLEASVEQPGAGWNYGNAVHHGNLVLGHVALHGDQIDEAEAYLLQAGKTPGSPQLNSFGPNMSLALALLKRDRKKAVIEYLTLCGKFWKKATTDAWIKDIEEGRTPNFGGNLRY